MRASTPPPVLVWPALHITAVAVLLPLLLLLLLLPENSIRSLEEVCGENQRFLKNALSFFRFVSYTPHARAAQLGWSSSCCYPSNFSNMPRGARASVVCPRNLWGGRCRCRAN